MKRYDDCENEQGCSSCSLSSRGRDCRNNPINPIKYLRGVAGITSTTLAKMTGINIRTIQKYENGENDIGNMTLNYAIKICDVLGVDDLRSLIDGNI